MVVNRAGLQQRNEHIAHRHLDVTTTDGDGTDGIEKTNPDAPRVARRSSGRWRSTPMVRQDVIDLESTYF